jgi:hypothetical protein
MTDNNGRLASDRRSDRRDVCLAHLRHRVFPSNFSSSRRVEDEVFGRLCRLR